MGWEFSATLSCAATLPLYSQAIYCLVIILAGLIFCDHAAVTVSIRTRQASAELTLLPRLGSASRTTDGEYLFWATFFRHDSEIMP